MVAEGDMNNRVVQPAEGPRAAETFVVDLTSVCLRSGTVRLPLSLIGRFSEGQHRVTAGGEELLIEFEAPRSLLGLASFFERTELKANDRVRFVFNGQHLALEAHKRERTKTGRVAHGPAQPGLNVAQALQVSERPNNGQARLTTRGVFPAPSELVDKSDLREPGQVATPKQSASADEAPAVEGPAPSAIEGSVRRVRIEGGPAPRTDTVAPRPLDRASAHDVWARRQQPAWRALDTMVAGPVVPPEEAAEAFSESTVRVVRRSKGTSLPLEVEAPPLPKPEPEATPATRAPFSYSMSWPLPETPRKKPAARPADGPPTRAPHSEVPAEPIAADPRAQLDPYLDAPIDADREEFYTPPTILESDLLAIPSGGKWRAESEEAFLKYQENQVLASAEPVAVPTERRQGLLGRLGLGRSARGPAERAGAASAPGPERTQWQPPATESAASSAEPKVPEVPEAPDPDWQPTVQIAGENGAQEAASTAHVPDAVTSEKRVIVDESVYDVDFDTEVQPQLTATEGPQDSLEADMAKLRSYLAQPGVPAIVRCDDLAARLHISQERVASAMYRLSEDRERYTPLRGDAYMVRRAR